VVNSIDVVVAVVGPWAGDEVASGGARRGAGLSVQGTEA
jgi:hypothetical protein